MITQPIIQPVSEKLYVLVADYEYSYKDKIIHLDAGMTSDLASVPKLLWNIIPRDGLATGPAFIHDWLYTRSKTQPQFTHGTLYYGFNRAECDKVLLQALLDAGCSWIKAHTMYRAVRMFGWVSGGVGW